MRNEMREVVSAVVLCLMFTVHTVGQVSEPPSPWTIQRMTVADNNVYRFAKWKGDTRVGPQLVKMSASADGEAREEARYDLWGWWAENCERIPMRWRVGATTLYTACHIDSGPGLGQSAALTCWPFEVLIPGPRAMFVDGTYQKVWDQTTHFSLGPVSGAAGGSMQLTQDGYRIVGPGAFEALPVYFDFRPLDEVRVELLMTVGGRPSLWQYDGTQDTEEWKNRLSMVGKTIIGDPDEPFLAQSGWHHKKNLSVTIDGPFLWMQDPKYVLAEREGNWCVIGPLDAAEPEVRPIIAKDAEHPLVLVEDVAAKADYFRLGDKLMDDRGAVIERVDASKPLDDQMREVVSKVALRRRER